MQCGVFKRRISSYFRLHGRDFPWRRTSDPYKILVSEIMLQQTQVSRVREKYPPFVRAFPSFKALAEAPFPKILSVWQGMGYNRRALALKRIAEIVTSEYTGNLPSDPDLLMRLPGIGKATAGSICAFAFNTPTLFIETNIRRVFIHFFFPGRNDVHDDEILQMVDKTLDRKNPREWYWALMDYGTFLSKSIPNPNHRSRHYSKQKAFTGSDREVRGKILRVLITSGRTTRNLSELLKQPIRRISPILAQMEKEGMIQIRKGRASLVS